MDRPKYQVVRETLWREIQNGKFQPGDKLPSEAALVKKFATSRITVGRALRELQQHGLIERIAGSGSYVTGKPAELPASLLFGLLIPDLGKTEIFEPICKAIASAPGVGDHALLWGHADSSTLEKGEQARELCRQYLQRKVSGVFFAPLEFEREAEKTNRAVLAALGNAGIPVVLLDHRPAAAAEVRRYDVVGLNNMQAGYRATQHLIHLGCRRIGFLGYHGSTSAISSRKAGCRLALRENGLEPLEERPTAPEPEGWVCVNDRMAATLMQSLLAAGTRIPEDVRIVGIDDAEFASFLPVPLTTIGQPCKAIGEAALNTMLERIRHPQLPARDLLFDGELIVRKSCGAGVIEATRRGAASSH